MKILHLNFSDSGGGAAQAVLRLHNELLNKNIESLKSNYAVKDVQDLLAMTALQFATKNVENLNSIEYDKLNEAIVLLNQELTFKTPSS